MKSGLLQVFASSSVAVAVAGLRRLQWWACHPACLTAVLMTINCSFRGEAARRERGLPTAGDGDGYTNTKTYGCTCQHAATTA